MKTKIDFKSKTREMGHVTVGVMLTALAFSFFLDPYGLVIGGVSGLAILFEGYLDSSLTILICNVVLLLIALLLLGKEYFLKTIYGALTFPLFTWIFNLVYKKLVEMNDGNVLIDESQMFMITVASALILGVGIGLAMKNGGSTGGTEIVQNILYKYFRIPYSLSLFLFDGTIVAAGFFVMRDASGNLKYDFLLYAIMFIYLSGIVMDQIMFRGFNKRAVNIISVHNEEIKERILKDFERGVTQINVIGGYTGETKSNLVCVLSSTEFYKLKKLINEIDPKAFYYVVRASEVGGEGFTYAEQSLIGLKLKSRKEKK